MLMSSRQLGSTDDGEELTTLEFAGLDVDGGNNCNDEGNGTRDGKSGLKSRPPSARRSRRQSSAPEWTHVGSQNGKCGPSPSRSNGPSASLTPTSLGVVTMGSMAATSPLPPTPKRSSSWSLSLVALVTAGLGVALLIAILDSLVNHHAEPKGCRMSYMRPSYIHYSEFDTEHTRFATKYSLYLYREQGMDDGNKLLGIPVLFIPGNAGSYKQVRPMAAEAANYFRDSLQMDGVSVPSGVRNLDFFTVDFNEDITAFHGQTLLDQAEYLNEAVRYILSLYSDPQRSGRDSQLPDPTSVIILGHSMGGIVARAMLVQPNYQPKSINTIITMSAPHARPPVTFDRQIVQIYEEINTFWRNAYAQKWANDNPLWHVTLVSIAGGSLDTVVPSDYASLESLVPETHGFTVFTTGIPTVWTSMDHQAILWCDQFRKVVARALYEIVDVHRASQTKPRADRIHLLRRRFLPGLEAVNEKTPHSRKATTLLTLGDGSSRIVPPGSRLTLRELGSQAQSQPQPRTRAHLIPIPPPGSPGLKRFTLLTDATLDGAGKDGFLQVLLCSVVPHQHGPTDAQFLTHVDLSNGEDRDGNRNENGNENGAPTRLACKNAASDATMLPASTSSTQYPFYRDGEQEIRPFTYFQYGAEHLADHQFIAIVDKAASPEHAFVVAEFSDEDSFRREYDVGLVQLLTGGLSFSLSASRPMVVDIRIPAAASALMAFGLNITQPPCTGDELPILFSPLVRQYLEKPYESKYFVNAQHATLSFHGRAPYVPPPLAPSADSTGLGLQLWSDPSRHTTLHVSLRFDMWASMGNLYMRYRTVFAAFPLLIVSMVLRKQFRVYDATGIFISFSAGLDLSLRRSIPMLLLSLTLMSTWLDRVFAALERGLAWPSGNVSPAGSPSFDRNELLIGTTDPLFWFLIPLTGIVCVGVCTVLHYIVLGTTWVIGVLYGFMNRERVNHQHQQQQQQPPQQQQRDDSAVRLSSTSTPLRRMISTAVLLFLVSTFIPYQFAYLVACLVQLFTSARAFQLARGTTSTSNANYHHYAHSILLLMMWVLPVNLPILAVWVRNLAVHWLTPFSSHHNVLSIMPFILLVENLTAGRMVPHIASGLRHITSALLFGTALCAAVYGVSHAYVLHYLVNAVAAWLVILHSTSDSWSLTTIGAMFEGNANEARKGDKVP
ncbi:hypothetical protein DCS_00806 [Drechmeria coniospora]|uniref:GPI inositol-deacylase n=1 Tax=Drechmeria coniospora TaxID=98403 RepID=A0A151GRN5_DRECN|nr:hypothetical protein DCS_00806 [Drechmeria coniospora]KYK59672.1 hypothetical protein DCS_00806 [Drechmeria coniospora]